MILSIVPLVLEGYSLWPSRIIEILHGMKYTHHIYNIDIGSLISRLRVRLMS